jgi:hypothetical protein
MIFRYDEKLSKFSVIKVVNFRVLSLVILSASWTAAQFDINLGNSTEHYANCTINNVVYYDDDCTDILKRFLTWLGFGLLVALFLGCGCLWYCICVLCRVICCNDRYEPRMVTRAYPNYSTLA